MMKKKILINHNQVIFILLLLIISTISCTPLLSKSRYYVFVGIAASVIILINIKQITSTEGKPLAMTVFLYLLLIYAYKLIGYSSAAWGNYMNQTVFFITLLLMLLIPKKLSKKQKIWTWLLIAVIMAFNISDNIRLSILYPNINTSRIYLDEDFLSSINAGGSSFYTFSLFFFISCFFVFLNSKTKLIKYISLAFAVLTAMYISWFCFKASVVLYFFLSVIMLVYAKHTRNRTLFFIILLFTVFSSYIFLAFFSDEIIDFIISNSPNERLTARFVTLIDADAQEANTFTVTGRTNLYMLSVNTWFDNLGNFLFGIGDHRAQFHAVTTGIGQHSDFLDTLARYGLLGFLFLVFFLKNILKYFRSFFAPEHWLQVTCVFIIFIFCGITKGVFYPPIGCALFLLFPLCSTIVKELR